MDTTTWELLPSSEGLDIITYDMGKMVTNREVPGSFPSFFLGRRGVKHCFWMAKYYGINLHVLVDHLKKVQKVTKSGVHLIDAQTS